MTDLGNQPLFTISIAAKILGVHPRTLMLYEKEKLILPHRTRTNRRIFSQNDLKKIHFIKYLTQTKGVNLKGVNLILEAIELTAKGNFHLRKRLFPDYSSPKNLLSS